MAIVDGDGAPQRTNVALEIMQSGPHGDGLRRVVDQLVKRARGRPPRRPLERRVHGANGRDAWVQLSVAVLEANRVLVQVVDVTARREREERLQRLAEREPLTGLWNRRRFEQELSRELARCRRQGERATLVVLDVDGLKRINDSYGHKAGDAIIRHVAAVLSSRLRATDSIARIGGDEFAVLLAGTAGHEATTTVAELCRAIATTAVTAGAATIEVTASAGCSDVGPDTLDEDAAFAAADAELYRAKGRERRFQRASV